MFSGFILETTQKGDFRRVHFEVFELSVLHKKKKNLNIRNWMTVKKMSNATRKFYDKPVN